MSNILSNLNNFLFESEIEIDDKFINIFEVDRKEYINNLMDPDTPYNIQRGIYDPTNSRLNELRRSLSNQTNWRVADRLDDERNAKDAIKMREFWKQREKQKSEIAANDNAIAAMKARPHVDTKGSGDSISYLKQQQLRQSHDPSDQALYSGDKIKTYGHSNDLSDHALYTGAKGAKLPVTKVNMDDGAPSIAQKALKWGADNSTTIAAVSGAVLGAGLLAKYKNSIMRGQYLVNHYSKLASQAKNPAEKQAISQKLNWAKSKLANAQAKARVEHKNFIEKSQRMKSYINELNKAGRRQEAAKLQEKLAKRQRFLSKIGATI